MTEFKVTTSSSTMRRMFGPRLHMFMHCTVSVPIGSVPECAAPFAKST
eukprot:CAMPEP_0206041676 /NCGR_PEP_ID=MMETSP1466-20131121/6105_1 /ASSEMBLY_ACC=CAM_ASM_001126 /TAXON_ID=44452 /ORGANISM="Pavlova gyrans, Strain CCMP608" /LENGTH=47 /DNA_ID= /DNA_START= /DNA_END= /DNA_ORIENTATION=